MVITTISTITVISTITTISIISTITTISTITGLSSVRSSLPFLQSHQEASSFRRSYEKPLFSVRLRGLSQAPRLKQVFFSILCGICCRNTRLTSALSFRLYVAAALSPGSQRPSQAQLTSPLPWASPLGFCESQSMLIHQSEPPARSASVSDLALHFRGCPTQRWCNECQVSPGMSEGLFNASEVI